MWVHLSLCYCTPWRPTWLLMRRDEENDAPEEGLLGMVPVELESGTWLEALTQWELLLRWEALTHQKIFLKLYELVASRRHLLTLRPWTQRVRALPGCELDLCAVVPPKKPPRPPREGGRRGRGRGRG